MFYSYSSLSQVAGIYGRSSVWSLPIPITCYWRDGRQMGYGRIDYVFSLLHACMSWLCTYRLRTGLCRWRRTVAATDHCRHMSLTVRSTSTFTSCQQPLFSAHSIDTNEELDSDAIRSETWIIHINNGVRVIQYMDQPVLGQSFTSVQLSPTSHIAKTIQIYGATFKP